MLGGIQTIWREGCLDMTIGGNGFVWSVAGLSAFELGDVLADQVAFDAVAGDESQTFLKDFEFSESREFVNHSQEPDDHVDNDPDQRFEPGFIVRFRHDIQRNRIDIVHEVLDPKIGPARISSDGWIAEKIEITLRGGQNRAGFVWRAIEHVPSRSADYRVIGAVDVRKRKHLDP